MLLSDLEVFSIDHCLIFMSFNSCFRPQLGCLQAGRRSETVKGDATLSTTTAEPLHGHDPSFRYKAGFLIDIYVHFKPKPPGHAPTVEANFRSGQTWYYIATWCHWAQKEFFPFTYMETPVTPWICCCFLSVQTSAK